MKLHELQPAPGSKKSRKELVVAWLPGKVRLPDGG